MGHDLCNDHTWQDYCTPVHNPRFRPPMHRRRSHETPTVAESLRDSTPTWHVLVRVDMESYSPCAAIHAKHPFVLHRCRRGLRRQSPHADASLSGKIHVGFGVLDACPCFRSKTPPKNRDFPPVRRPRRPSFVTPCQKTPIQYPASRGARPRGPFRLSPLASHPYAFNPL